MDRPVRALIVDDDETTCKLLTKVLERQGIVAVWTTDSVVGHELSRRDPYDLFIFDVYMPCLLGTEIAEKLKYDKPKAKIILISTFADEALRQTATRLGVTLLSKPFTPDRLLEATAQALSRQK